MDAEDFEDGARRLSLGIVRLSEGVSPSLASQTIVGQALRTTLSVDVKVRAFARAESLREMITRLGEAEAEGREAIDWLEMLVEADLVERASVTETLAQATRLLKQIGATLRDLRAKNDLAKESLPTYEGAPVGGWDLDEPR